MAEPNHFRSFELSQSEDGSPLELFRDEASVACLGFDTGRRCFVEICALGAGDSDHFLERAAAVASQSHPALSPIVDYGSEEGVFFYACDLVDGEPLRDYADRVSRVPAEAAVAWMLALVSGAEALAGLGLYPDLERARMVLRPGGGVGVRLADFGIAGGTGSPVGEVVRSTLERLTNFQSAGEAPVYPREIDLLLGELPDDADFERTRAVLEGFGEVPPTPAVGGALRPRLLMEREMYRHARPEHVLPSRYRVLERAGDRDPYRSIVERTEDDLRLRILVLPPERLLSDRMLEVRENDGCAARLQVAAFWAHDDFRLLAEELEAGIPLSAWIAARENRPAEDVLAVMESIETALETLSAANARVHRLDPDDCFVDFGAAAGPGRPEGSPTRDWPDFAMRLRCHPTMRALTDGRTGELPLGAEDVMDAAQRGEDLPAAAVLAWYFNLRNRGLHYQASELVASLRELSMARSGAVEGRDDEVPEEAGIGVMFGAPAEVAGEDAHFEGEGEHDEPLEDPPAEPGISPIAAALGLAGDEDDATDGEQYENPIARGMSGPETAAEEEIEEIEVERGPVSAISDMLDLPAEEDRAGCNFLLILFVLIIAVAIAAVVAHLTGKAFWLQN